MVEGWILLLPRAIVANSIYFYDGFCLHCSSHIDDDWIPCTLSKPYIESVAVGDDGDGDAVWNCHLRPYNNSNPYDNILIWAKQ